MRSVLFLISTVFNIATGILGLRFLLKLFGANPAAMFTRWIYETSQPLLHPFAGMFPVAVDGRFVFDFSTLFAIAIYSLVGYLITELVVYLYQVMHHPAVRPAQPPRHQYSIHSTLI